MGPSCDTAVGNVDAGRDPPKGLLDMTAHDFASFGPRVPNCQAEGMGWRILILARYLHRRVDRLSGAVE
jgi:hypothetical protein